MIVLLTIWTAMAALAIECARHMEFFAAVIAWSIAAAIACAVGAFLISQQPLSIATTSGRFGSAVVHWGYRAGHGRLILAAMISWLIWFAMGTATIAAVQFSNHRPIVIAWTGDLIGVFYIAGVMLVNVHGRTSTSLIKLTSVILGLLGGSAFLWFRTGTDQARAIALAIAGGPPLLIGAIQGFVLTSGVISARFRHH